MQQVAILTTSSSNGLGIDAEGRLVEAIGAAGHRIESVNWLSGGSRRGGNAVEAILSPAPDSPADGVLSGLRGAFADEDADINLVPAENRRKKLLVADMDSTIIASESLVELARLAGKGGDVEKITTRAMRGELDFVEALGERVRMLAGCPAALIDTVIEETAYNPGAPQLVATMKHHGARTILASGGFTFLSKVVAERLGFDDHFANRLLVENGTITGKVGEPVLDQNAKRNLLGSEAGKLGLTLADCATIGDGANDRGMTEAAGLGVAYRGKPALKEATPFWLDHTDLRGLLWLQGYGEDAIVAPGRA